METSRLPCVRRRLATYTGLLHDRLRRHPASRHFVQSLATTGRAIADLILTGEISDINRVWLVYRCAAIGIGFVKGVRSAHAEHVGCREEQAPTPAVDGTDDADDADDA